MRSTVFGVVALCFLGSAALAAPIPPAKVVSPLDRIETLRGPVEIRSTGRKVVVSLHEPDNPLARRFDVSTDASFGRGFDFRAQTAEIHYWRGHLVIVAPEQRKVFHFSIDGIKEQVASDSVRLDALVQAGYALTHFDTADSISSMNHQALKVWERLRLNADGMDDEFPDYGSGGGLGGCGTSCNITCGDGSSCSTNCSSRRCASCTCPANCSCS